MTDPTEEQDPVRTMQRTGMIPHTAGDRQPAERRHVRLQRVVTVAAAAVTLITADRRPQAEPAAADGMTM